MSLQFVPLSAVEQPGEPIARLAGRVVAAGLEAVTRRGRFTLALSPSALDGALVTALKLATPADAKFWGRTHVFWTDTRFGQHGGCPAVARTLLGCLPIPRRAQHLSVADEANPIRAAAGYEQKLRALFGAAAGVLPAFDCAVVALGLGGDVAGLTDERTSAFGIDRLVVTGIESHTDRRFVTFSGPMLANVRLLLVRSDCDEQHAVAQLAAQLGSSRTRGLQCFASSTAGGGQCLIFGKPTLPHEFPSPMNAS